MYRKGSEYMRIEYILDTKENFMSHTDRKISERVTNMRIEYINWITEKKFFMSYTGRKYRQGSEYAYRIY